MRTLKVFNFWTVHNAVFNESDFAYQFRSDQESEVTFAISSRSLSLGVAVPLGLMSLWILL